MQYRNIQLTALIGFMLLIVSSAAAQGVRIFALGRDDNSIRRLDVIAGMASSPIPITVTGKTVASSHGLARDPQTGVVYALVEFSDSVPGIRSLITMDLSNGSGSIIGNVDDGTGISIGAITVTSSGILLGVSDLASPSEPGKLFSIDKVTGTAEPHATFSFSDVGQGLAFNVENGLVYRLSGFTDMMIQFLDPASLQIPATDLMLDYHSILPTALLHVGGSRFLFSTDTGDLYLLNADSGKIRYLSSPGAAVGLTAVPDGSCPPQAALYGAGPLEGPQFLTAVDPATGSSSFIGAIGFNDIAGLHFAPDGVLYATGTRDDDSGVAVLLTIDPCTGKGAEVGATTASLRALSIQADGTALTYSGSVLSKVDRTTATVTPIGDSGILADDFGFDFSSADNRLYFGQISNGIGELFSIDQASGASILQSQSTLPPNITALRAMGFDAANDQMYALLAEGGLGSATYLATLDTFAHTVSLVAPTSSNLRTLAFTSGSPAAIYALTLIKEGSGTGMVTSNPVGINCGATCDYSFAAGTQVELIASPHAGSIFAGWSGACTGAGACVTRMDGMRTVRAAFASLPRFTLSVSKNGRGGWAGAF